MTLTRRTLMATAATFIAMPAFAEKPKWFTDGSVAIGGYDPVAYFDENGPVAGSAEFTSEFDGAVFQFASAENKAKFDENPEGFAPQYGGYCAYAVSKGYTASTEPDAWSIHDGKLYLNFNKSVRALWSANKKNHIKNADLNWPAVLKDG